MQWAAVRSKSAESKDAPQTTAISSPVFFKINDIQGNSPNSEFSSVKPNKNRIKSSMKLVLRIMKVAEDLFTWISVGNSIEKRVTLFETAFVLWF